MLKAPAHGLVGIGGKISSISILKYYSKGIFPWGKENGMPLWFCPDPRWVIFPNQVKVTSSMKKIIRNGMFSYSADRCFTQVLENCATVRRKGQRGTWIDDEIKNTFFELHKKHLAHSLEVWLNGNLAGGLYGLAVGKVFFGESMFHFESNASKAALIILCRFLIKHDYKIIDAQAHNSFLESMGAKGLPRVYFLKLLNKLAKEPQKIHGSWENVFDWFVNNELHEMF